jgi:hypothetical protein
VVGERVHGGHVLLGAVALGIAEQPVARAERPRIDEWADAQSSELDAQKRKEFQRKIWDRVQDQVWRVDKPAAKGYEVLQPWVRNVSFTGPFNANYSFTELAAPSQLERAWLDK